MEKREDNKFTHVAFPLEDVQTLIDLLVKKSWEDVDPVLQKFKLGRLCNIIDDVKDEPAIHPG